MTEKAALTEAQVAAIVEAGGRRWQKNGMDRIYFNATAFGLKVDRYKSGNICNATFDGSWVSNSEACRIMAAKAYVDVKTGELDFDFGRVRADVREAFEEKVRAVVDSALAAEQEGDDATPAEGRPESAAGTIPDGPEGDAEAALEYAAARAAAYEADAEKARRDAEHAAEGVRRAEAGDAWDYFRRPRLRSRSRVPHPEAETPERALEGWRKVHEDAELKAERCSRHAKELRAWQPSPWEEGPDGSLRNAAGDRLTYGYGGWRLYPAGFEEGDHILMARGREGRIERRADRAIVDILCGARYPRQ